MTIEAGPKPNGVRPAAADTRNQKNKSMAAEGGGGGFGAILASVDSSETADQPAVDVVDAKTSADPVAVSTSPTIPGLDPLAKDMVLADESYARRAGKGLDTLGLVAADSNVFGDGKIVPKDPLDALAAAALPVPVPVPDAAVVSASAPMDAAALVSQVSQWLSAAGQVSQPESQKPGSAVAQLPIAGAKPPQPVVDLQGSAALTSFTFDAPVETLGKSGKLQRDFAGKQALSADVLMASAQSAAQPESRSQPLAVKLVDQATVPVAVTLAAASTMMPMRREEQSRERSVFRSNVSEVSAFSQSFMPTTATTAVQYTADLKMSPDVFVAEKVAYWISNDVQNAEMRLDGIGLDPVEVSIRMHGNEAQVAFRTDELQARAALENASTHLKELLQREGLVLTGVSVETAGAGNSGDRDPKSRQGSRQTTIGPLSPVRADHGAVAGRVAGGALDLFV
jgi:flagellar hook-length control protein FliK